MDLAERVQEIAHLGARAETERQFQDELLALTRELQAALWAVKQLALAQAAWLRCEAGRAARDN